MLWNGKKSTISLRLDSDGVKLSKKGKYRSAIGFRPVPEMELPETSMYSSDIYTGAGEVIIVFNGGQPYKPGRKEETAEDGPERPPANL